MVFSFLQRFSTSHLLLDSESTVRTKVRFHRSNELVLYLASVLFPSRHERSYSSVCQNPLHVVRIEKLFTRDPSLQHHHKAVRVLLITTQCEVELEQFRRDGSEPGGCNIFAIFGHNGFVSSTLISHQGLIQRCLAREAFVDSRGQKIRVTKGVANSVCHHGVFVAAGIAYECPARAGWTAQEIRQIGSAIEPLFAASGAHSFPQSGNLVHN